MSASQIYIAIAILVLAVIAGLFVFVWKRKKRGLSPLAGISFAFILAGLLFSEERLVGYGLLGVGIILAVVDILLQKKRKQSVSQPR